MQRSIGGRTVDGESYAFHGEEVEEGGDQECWFGLGSLWFRSFGSVSLGSLLIFQGPQVFRLLLLYCFIRASLSVKAGVMERKASEWRKGTHRPRFRAHLLEESSTVLFLRSKYVCTDQDLVLWKRRKKREGRERRRQKREESRTSRVESSPTQQ